MSSNVGLTTPRGSGTSGYVQRNLSHLKPRDAVRPYPSDFSAHKQRKPDPQILEHDRKRRIELAVFELRDKLEEAGDKDEDETDDACDALRKKLIEDEERNGAQGRKDARGLKGYEVHDLAEAKIEETEKMRRALGIRKDYEEGSHWTRQEERLRDAVPEKDTKERRDDDKPRRRYRDED